MTFLSGGRTARKEEGKAVAMTQFHMEAQVRL